MGRSMQQEAFETELKSGGYVEIETKAIEPHGAPFPL
jgi:hypothetical protein